MAISVECRSFSEDTVCLLLSRHLKLRDVACTADKRATWSRLTIRYVYCALPFGPVNEVMDFSAGELRTGENGNKPVWHESREWKPCAESRETGETRESRESRETRETRGTRGKGLTRLDEESTEPVVGIHGKIVSYALFFAR